MSCAASAHRYQSRVLLYAAPATRHARPPSPLCRHPHHPCHTQVFVYCVTPRRDTKSEYLRTDAEAAGCTWRSVAATPERALADTIRADRVDVLLELTGHTAHNRLGVMRYRPAPVQMTWIGYPNSTGLAAVDCRITDTASDPVGTAQTYTEELLRLPGCFLCYTPMRAPPAVSPAPCTRHGYLTFGSFNALAKVTDEVIDVRCRHLPPCVVSNNPQTLKHLVSDVPLTDLSHAPCVTACCSAGAATPHRTCDVTAAVSHTSATAGAQTRGCDATAGLANRLTIRTRRAVAPPQGSYNSVGRHPELLHQ